MVRRPQRWSLVDDTDDWRVTYDGPWTQEPAETWNGVGLNGSPFRDTLHSIRQNGTVTVKFKGNKFSVYGSVRGYSGPPEGLKVWWNCTVDGIESGWQDPYPTTDKNYHRQCFDDNLDWKEHTLVIRVTSKDNEPYYFDTMDYPHAVNESRTNRRSIVTTDDEELDYSPGWGRQGPYRATNVKGGSVQFPFDGVSVAWYAGFTSSMSRTQASATWSVDGSPPVEFNLPGPPAGDTQSRTKFFETPKVSPGSHMLEVVYKGDVSAAPLTLWQLYIDHGGIPDTLNLLEGGEAKGTDMKTAAVGAGLGGALVLVICASIFFFMRFRKRKSYASKNTGSIEYSPVSQPVTHGYVPSIQPYDTSAQVVNASGAQQLVYQISQQTSSETMYSGNRAQVPVTQLAVAPHMRAVPPPIPMRTGKGFVQTRNPTPTPPSSSASGPQSSYGGSSVVPEEHPPVYS